ncbi:VRR-NUC domain-containing protein [Aquirufa sp. A-Brett2-15D]
MSEKSEIELSATYYWDHFSYILRYLDRHYLPLLQESEIVFLQDFSDLSFAAQCLYLRLASRRSSFFRVEKLSYPEIGDVARPLQVLRSAGFLMDISEGVESIFTKQECVVLAKKQGIKVPSSASKDEVAALVSSVDLIAEFSAGVVAPLRLEVFTFIQFLFFGTRSRDLTDFVVRDLGHRAFVEVQEDDLKPYFQTREEAEQKWSISMWREWFYNTTVSVDEILASWRVHILPLSTSLLDPSIRSFESACFSLGRSLERNKAYLEALEVYEVSMSGASLERRVRILQKLGELEEAVAWARVGLEICVSPTEIHFFEDFLAKQASKKSIKQVTSSLKQAEIIEISPEYIGQVEAGVAAYFESQGYYAAFTENQIWRNFLGLFAWDLIFTDRKDGFHHPFQWAPSHYAKESFAGELPLHLLSDRVALLDVLRSRASENQGSMNPLVDWYSLDFELMERFLTALPTEGLAAISQYMWTHLGTHVKGFPDLFIQRGDEYAFVEVKSPNDHLSAIQHFWHDFLRKNGVVVRLVRLKYFSPEGGSPEVE